MTAQTQARGTVRLGNCQPERIQGCATIHNVIGHARKIVVPQRRRAIRVMGGMAENASVRLRSGFDGSGTGNAEVMNGIDDGIGVDVGQRKQNGGTDKETYPTRNIRAAKFD